MKLKRRGFWSVVRRLPGLWRRHYQIARNYVGPVDAARSATNFALSLLHIAIKGAR
jgi:hypothetical protein